MLLDVYSYIVVKGVAECNLLNICDWVWYHERLNLTSESLYTFCIVNIVHIHLFPDVTLVILSKMFRFLLSYCLRCANKSSAFTRSCLLTITTTISSNFMHSFCASIFGFGNDLISHFNLGIGHPPRDNRTIRYKMDFIFVEFERQCFMMMIPYICGDDKLLFAYHSSNKQLYSYESSPDNAWSSYCFIDLRLHLRLWLWCISESAVSLSKQANLCGPGPQKKPLKCGHWS